MQFAVKEEGNGFPGDLGNRGFAGFQKVVGMKIGRRARY
jgi:hypothetical protein